MATTLSALVMKIGMDASEVEAGSAQVRSDVSRVNNVFREMQTETDKVTKKIESVVRQFRRGKINSEQYAAAMEHLGKRYNELTKKTTIVDKAIAKITATLTPQRLAIAASTAAIAAATGAIVAMVQAYRTATQKMAELDPIIKQSRAMGELTANVQTLAFALSESAGMSIDETTQSLMELQKRLGEAQLGTGEAANALKILGLNAAEVARLSPVEQFRLVAAELQKVEDATMRAYLADKLFAEQGKKLVNGLTQSNQTLAEAEQAARNFGLAISDIQATGIEAANDALGRVSAQIDGIITQFSAELAPAIAFLASELSRTLPLGSTLSHTFKEIAETVVATYAVLGDWANILTGVILVKQGDIAEGFRMIKIGVDGTFSQEALQRYDEMKRQIAKSAQLATQMRTDAETTAAPVQNITAEYDKQVQSLKGQIDTLNGIDVAHQQALAARKEMSSVQREYLAILDRQLKEEQAYFKKQEEAAKAEEKRLNRIEELRKRGQDMVEQGDPGKQLESQIADLNVLLGVLGESFRSTYDREIQKLIKDAAEAKVGTADRPQLIEAGSAAAYDFMTQDTFAKQEEQLRLAEEQKLLQQAMVQAQAETNRRLAEIKEVGIIR